MISQLGPINCNCLNSYHNYHHVKRVPLSSTRQFYAKEPLFFCPKNPSVSHEKSVSSPHKNVSSTQKKHQFNTLTLFMWWTEGFMCWTDAFVCWTDGFLYWTDGCGKRTHLTCWSDGFSGLKRTRPGVELIC